MFQLNIAIINSYGMEDVRTDLACGCPHCGVILQAQVLQGLHKPSLHVAGLCCLHGRVYQTLTPGHCVEEELCWGQT